MWVNPRNKLNHPLPQQLQSERIRQGLTQLQLADRLGVHAPSLSAWEHGAVVPSFPSVLRWCEALGVEVAFTFPSVQGEGEVGTLEA